MSSVPDASLPENLPNGGSPLPGILTAGQPSAAQMAQLAESGVKTVIDLRSPDEPRGFDEPAVVREAGMTYHNVPVSPATLGESEFEKFRELLDAENSHPVLVHCGSANRVGALLIPYLMLDKKRDRDEALKIARDVGLRSDDLTRIALGYVADREPGLTQK